MLELELEPCKLLGALFFFCGTVLALSAAPAAFVVFMGLLGGIVKLIGAFLGNLEAVLLGVTGAVAAG